MDRSGKSSNNDILYNKIRGIVLSVLRVSTAMCASGTLMQIFLFVLGFESKFVYAHSTLIQLASVLSIMLSSRWADKGNIIKRSAFICIPNGILFLLYIPLCIANNASMSIYIVILGLSIIQAIVNGLITVCEYKLPYFIYKNDDYGQVLSVSGIISGVLTLGIGVLISTLTKEFSYVNIMIVAFGISGLFMALSVVIGLFHKSLINEEEKSDCEKKEKISLMEIFRHVTFYKLFFPNLFRGITIGTVSVLAAVALDIGFSEAVASAMVSVQSVATLLSCAIFAVYSKKVSSKVLILIGSSTFLLLPMMIVKNNVLFLIVYGIVFFGQTLVSYAVPDMLFKIVPLEIAGPYHAYRMVLNNGEVVLGTVLATILPVSALLVITVVFQILSGIMYTTTKIENR